MQRLKRLVPYFLLILLLFTVGCGTEKPEDVKQNPSTTEGENTGLSYPGLGPDSIANIVEQVSPAVVKIETVVVEQVENPLLNDPFFREFFGGSIQPKAQARPGLGSGFVISQEGYIITNQHVIEGATQIQVRLKGKKEALPAEVIGADYDLDMAVIKIKGSKDLPTLKLGDSEDIKVGNWVIAIGSPYGLEDTVTVGVISAKERPVNIGNRHYKHLLQTDASINPGNSGGPLLNLKGEVVGINTAINAQAQGIGFAIPSSTVKSVLDELIKEGHVTKPWIGVQIETLTPEIASYYGLRQDWGVIIMGVISGSPAAKSGLQQGDIVTSMDDKKVATVDELTDIVQAKQVGEKIKIEAIRNGQKVQITLEVAERPTTGR